MHPSTTLGAQTKRKGSAIAAKKAAAKKVAKTAAKTAKK